MIGRVFAPVQDEAARIIATLQYIMATWTGILLTSLQCIRYVHLKRPQVFDEHDDKQTETFLLVSTFLISVFNVVIEFQFLTGIESYFAYLFLTDGPVANIGFQWTFLLAAAFCIGIMLRIQVLIRANNSTYLQYRFMSSTLQGTLGNKIGIVLILGIAIIVVLVPFVSEVYLIIPILSLYYWMAFDMVNFAYYQATFT